MTSVYTIISKDKVLTETASNKDRTRMKRGEGGKKTNIQALHSSGCLKGKARPLSIAAILMQESELVSGHSASYSEGREDQRSHHQQLTDWLMTDDQTSYWSLSTGLINWDREMTTFAHLSIHDK